MRKKIQLLSALFLLGACRAFATQPTAQAVVNSFSNLSTTSMTVNWGRGNGAGVIVVCRLASNAIAYPVDGYNYTAGATFGSGSNLGNGNYVIYKGTGTGMTLSGLTANTQYAFTAFEYNNDAFPPDPYNYLTSPVNQAYRYTLAVAPTVQASALAASAITSSGATLTWTSGNGAYELASVKAGTSNTNLPVNGTAYSASTTYGSGSALGASPYSYVVFLSSSNTVTVTGCSPATDYVANCFTYNGLSGAQNYLLSGYPTKGFTTLADEPTATSTWTYITDVSDTAFTINWMKPAGSGVYSLVTLQQSSSNTELPVDGTAYTANSVFGSGSVVTSASYVVYNGSGNSVRVTGLTKNLYYTAAIFEFNGGSGTYNNTQNYLTSTYSKVGNYTHDKEPAVAASSLTLTPSMNSISASWTNGNGSKRLVAVRPGRVKTALAFDGTNDYVNVPYNAALQPTSEVTVEAWAYRSDWSTSTGTQVIAGNFYGAGGYLLFISGGNIYADVARNGSGTYLHNSISYLTPGWHHFAMSYDGRYTDIFIDGAKKAEDDAGAAYPITYAYSNNFTIGAGSGSGTSPAGYYFNGYIDEVRVWNVARTYSQIRSYMNQTLMGNESGLVAEWQMDDGYASGSTVKDNCTYVPAVYQSSINGTMTNMTTPAATSYTGTSGWILSGAVVDAPIDNYSYGASTVFMSGGLVSTGYYGVANTTLNTVTVTNLTPATYYDVCVYEYNGGYTNYRLSSYAMADVQTTSAPLPTITSFTPTSGSVGTVVTINGTNFDATAANNKVYFGTEQATVVSATTTQLQAVVPYCTNNVIISENVNSLNAFSKTPFVVTGPCSVTIGTSSLTNYPIAGGTARYGLAAGDITPDGKTDLVTCDYSTGYMLVYRNQSANGTLSWNTPYSFVVPTPINVVLPDIDGDQKLDPVVVSYGGNVFGVFRNKSTSSSVSLGTRIDFPTLSTPHSICASDIDKDGKTDIIIGYSGSSPFSVFRNTSSVGYPDFASRVDVTCSSGAYFALAAADLDGDGKEDLVAAGGADTLAIFRNTSTAGSISFAAGVKLFTGTAGAHVYGVALSDIDNDGKIDIVAALSNNTVKIFRNTNSSGSITTGNLTAQATLTTLSSTPAVVSCYDIDGDGGLNDVVVGYYGTGKISVFEHTALSFTFGSRIDFASTEAYSEYLALDDFSLDGKTDIAVGNLSDTISVYNNVMNSLSSEPTTASSGISFASISQTSMQVNFTAGNGANRIVVARQGSPVSILPFDGRGYTANASFGTSGTDLGGGQYVVYNGSSNSVTVTNLQSYNTYYFAVFEYNGATCTANYLTSPYGSSSAATLNTPPTLNSISNPSAICQDPGQQSVSLSGIGTGAANEVQTITVTGTSGNQTLIPNANISVSYTSPSATGTLYYTPASGQSGTAVITVTVNDNATNNNTIVKSFTVTITPAPTTANAGSNQTICASATGISANTPTVGTGTWTIVYTSNGAVTISNPASPSTALNNLLNVGDSVRLAWTISNPPCASSVSYVSVKKILCPLTADFLAGQTNYCGTSASVSFTDQSTVPSPNSIIKWEWSFPGGSPATYSTTVSPGNPPSVSYTAAGTYNVSLKVTDNTAGTDTKTKSSYITITDYPGTATTINGNTAVCQGQAGVTYSVPPISGASSYTWTVPAGASVNSGQGNSSIVVDYGVGASSGNIVVQGLNSCGGGNSYSLAVTVNPLPGATSTISGPASICPNQNGVVFSVSPIAGATTYTWTLPAGGTISGPNTGASITVNFSSSTSGIVDVLGVNSCGTGTSSSGYLLNVLPLPDPAGVIAGPDSVCEHDTVAYAIAALGNANTYTWTLPAGASILSGAGTNAITVAYGAGAASGTVAVNGVNSCGNGSAALLPVTVSPMPGNATAILVNSGNTTLCAGSTGNSCFVSAIPNATDYTWILPAGYSISSGSNTNSILLDIAPTAQSGTIAVYGSNACGDGGSSSSAITIAPLPDSAQAITGADSVCQSQNGVVYQVPVIANATGYNWTLPVGAGIVSGANTNSVTVNFSTGALSGFITVIGTNACGNGLAPDSFAVVVNPLPGAAGTITGDSAISICPVQSGVKYSIPAVLNATGYNWTVPTGAAIVSGSNTNSITVNYVSTAQGGNITVTPVNACGNGISSSVLIKVDTVMSQAICLITVDSTSTRNLISWEKPVTGSIDSFRIYREISSAFKLVGKSPYSAVTLFTDTTNGVNPNITSYKYEISAVDSCGNESPLSAFHRTIHLAVSPASPCGYNLSWNDYIGIPVTQYVIMRDSAGRGWKAVDSVSFGNNAWTDTRCYPLFDTVRYYIRIDHPLGCVSSIKNPSPLAVNLNTSKSNIYRIVDSTATRINEMKDAMLAYVYPNPGQGIFNVVTQEQSGVKSIQIMNVLGEKVGEFALTGARTRIDLSGAAKGVYYVRFLFADKTITRKLIIE